MSSDVRTVRIATLGLGRRFTIASSGASPAIVSCRVLARIAQARCEVSWERRGLSGHNAADVNAMDG